MINLKYDNLIGKEWIPNVSDCFSLTINFFKQNFDIDIPNFSRPNDWNADKLDLIKTLYPKTGFEMVEKGWEDLRPADVLCVAVNSSNPNHFVINLGDNELLHHLFGRLSGVDPLRPYWKMSTGYILRHPDVPDLRPVYPDVTIEELLRANYKF